jgi:hypothetical protein
MLNGSKNLRIMKIKRWSESKIQSSMSGISSADGGENVWGFCDMRYAYDDTRSYVAV